MASIGSYIKALRETKRYSERKLGILSMVSHATISRIENGISMPDPGTLLKLSAPLGVSYEVLLNIAGYLKGNRSIQSNIKLIRENKKMTYVQFSSDIKKVTGYEITPAILEQIESGNKDDISNDYIDLIARYEGIDVSFMFRENTPDDLKTALKVNSNKVMVGKNNEILSYIKDEDMKRWVMDPSNIDYLGFAKKIHDLGIDPDFVYEEFISKIFKKKKKRR
jgi:transcriptional regulator with XRE-family HTH domain